MTTEQAPDHVDEKDKYISVEEACRLLEIDQAEIDGLIKNGKLHAFRLGGNVLRFRKDQVSEVKAKWRINRDLFSAEKQAPHLWKAGQSNLVEGLKDFLYFNDFYIVSSLIIAALLYLILSSQ